MAAPGSRWLAAARRWWGLDRGEPDADAGAPPADPATPPALGAPSADEAPAVLLERLRRGVAHAVRHPGFGFALLRVQLELPTPGATPLRGGDLGRQVERRLQMALRPGDGLAPLPAPGAFVAVLDGVASEADLRAIVQRVLGELAAPLPLGPQRLQPQPRVGAVLCAPGQPPRPAEALLQRAERALRDAEPGSWSLAAPGERRPDAQRLQQALAGDGLLLRLEPQVEFGSAPRATALGVRLVWREHPARSADGADAGDDDVLAEALLQRQFALATTPYLQWRAADEARRACRLALPAPAALVRRAGWADEFAAQLQQAGLSGADVQLELPPTLVLADRNLPARLQALARQGIALALDDFGTGHSSLSALSRLPLALLKIDRGFVPQAHELEHHRVLLESTVRLATQLGIATLAKGLETASQLALLRGLGCQRGEGAAARALLAPQALAALPVAG
jgi:EAL domain-containing protein (putative c-di-GMP-specific phosphodiesterase class I)